MFVIWLRVHPTPIKCFQDFWWCLELMKLMLSNFKALNEQWFSYFWTREKQKRTRTSTAFDCYWKIFVYFWNIRQISISDKLVTTMNMFARKQARSMQFNDTCASEWRKIVVKGCTMEYLLNLWSQKRINWRFPIEMTESASRRKCCLSSTWLKTEITVQQSE